MRCAQRARKQCHRAASIDPGDEAIALAVAEKPLDPSAIGRPRGRLAVIGLGPGAAELMVPAVKAELARANDVLGYETYVRMAGPFAPTK